jgi:hypothetical protein
VLKASTERWRASSQEPFNETFTLLAGKTKVGRNDFWRIVDREYRMLEYLKNHPSDGGGLEPDLGKPCVASFGIGDLFVVEETWLGNVAREISFIENARGGENRVRVHERETEEVTLTETERISEESKSESLQTADRFEMQSAVTSQTNLQLGVNASVWT